MNYKDFQPKKTSRVRENIEWSTRYAYNATDLDSPRVLLIGDSICNGYQGAVRERLKDKANVSFWASSKCVTDPDYFRELDFILDEMPYSLISFNNGLHSLVSDKKEWDVAFNAAVDFIQAKLPETKLVLTLSTSLNEEWRTERSKALNAIVMKTAKRTGLPVIDLFTPTDALDKDKEMSDIYHFRAPAVGMQADIIAEKVVDILGLKSSGIIQESSLTGENGAVK